MKNSKCFYVVLLLLFVFGCSEGKYKYAQEIKKLESDIIRLPLNGVVVNQDARCDKLDIFNKSFKLVNYTDSIGCTSCAINQLDWWEDFIDYANKFNGRLKFYFIFSPIKKDLNSIKLAISNKMLNYPIMLDTLKEFERLNPHLPKNRALHTFLLDENNRVILVGNPLRNKKIKEMFYKIVEDKLGKPGEVAVKEN